MRIEIQNKTISISGYTELFAKNLREALTFTDKAKEYQLRRMTNNIYTRFSPLVKKLESEIEVCLVNESDGVITIPAGFAYMFSGESVVDMRKDTGVKVAYPWVKKPFDLRPYQREAVDAMKQHRRGLVTLATGLGKTLCATHLIREIGKRALIVCPSQSIADNFFAQLSETFGANKVGMFGGGKKQIRDITVGIAMSVNNHVDKFKAHDLGLIVQDETHRIAADTFYNIVSNLGDVGRIYGMTATDFRSDGKDLLLNAAVGQVVIDRDLVWGIQNGWLAKPTIVQRHVETTGHNYKDDKLKNYKSHVLNSDEMNAKIVADIQKSMAAGKSVLCLVDEKAHGRLLAEKVGLPFASGDDKNARQYVEQLNKEQIQGLIGTDSLIGEGTDTQNVDVLILANFVASKGVVYQNLGRGLRIYKGKDEVLIIDYKPMGSTMLSRHADQRLKLFKGITDNVFVKKS